MKERVVIRHKNIGDQYFHLLEMGRKMTPTERLISFFEMQEEYRKLHNEPEQVLKRKIVIKKVTWI